MVLENYKRDIFTGIALVMIFYALAFMANTAGGYYGFFSLQHKFLIFCAIGIHIGSTAWRLASYRKMGIQVMSKGESAVSAIADFAAFFLVLLSMVLLAFSIPTIGLEPTDDHFSAIRSKLFWINLVLIGIVLYALWNVWTRHTVGPNRIAIFNGRIFYPGETFRFFPLTRNTIEKLEQVTKIHHPRLYLEFQDGKFDVNVYVSHYLMFGIWEEKNIRTLDYDGFRQRLRKSDEEELQKLARQSTVGQFLGTQSVSIDKDWNEKSLLICEISASLA